MDNEDYEAEAGVVVGTYRDAERIGYRQEMATEIEGLGRLAQRQKMLGRKAEDRYIDVIENYFHELRDELPASDLSVLLGLFARLPTPRAKNAHAFVLAYIFSFNKDMKKIQALIDLSDRKIRQADVVRYYQLIQEYNIE